MQDILCSQIERLGITDKIILLPKVICKFNDPYQNRNFLKVEKFILGVSWHSSG